MWPSGPPAAALSADGARLLHAEAERARAHIAMLSLSATSVEGVDVVGPDRPDERLPSLLCLGVHGVEAEPVLIGLDRAGVAVHSGSACSSESIEPSPVLEAMGVDASHSLRVSVGWSTNEEDVAAFGAAFTGWWPGCARYGADVDAVLDVVAGSQRGGEWFVQLGPRGRDLRGDARHLRLGRAVGQELGELRDGAGALSSWSSRMRPR